MHIYRSRKSRRRIHETYHSLLRAWGVPVTSRDIPTRYGITSGSVPGTEREGVTDYAHATGTIYAYSHGSKK